MKTSKTIILVRHAQSEENVKIQHLCDGVSRIQRFQLPTAYQAYQSATLVKMSQDSKLSELGKQQISDMHSLLKISHFWEQYQPQLIVYSPLLRAKMTCMGLLPDDMPSIVGANCRIMPLEELREATPLEHVIHVTFDQRIEKFKRWLVDVDAETIVVVGHSQYFKRMLGLKTLMRNCDVWQCTFSPRDSRSEADHIFSDLRLLHRTHLADCHPWDRLKQEYTGAGGEIQVLEMDGETLNSSLHASARDQLTLQIPRTPDRGGGSNPISCHGTYTSLNRHHRDPSSPPTPGYGFIQNQEGIVIDDFDSFESSGPSPSRGTAAAAAPAGGSDDNNDSIDIDIYYRRRRGGGSKSGTIEDDEQITLRPAAHANVGSRSTSIFGGLDDDRVGAGKQKIDGRDESLGAADTADGLCADLSMDSADAVSGADPASIGVGPMTSSVSTESHPLPVSPTTTTAGTKEDEEAPASSTPATAGTKEEEAPASFTPGTAGTKDEEEAHVSSTPATAGTKDLEEEDEDPSCRICQVHH
jgi:phosphohistidine phosphatase SixA